MKEKIASGIAWVMLATILSKVLTVIAQIVLGYYLAIENFGIYATALGMTAAFSWLRNGSIMQLMLKEAVRNKNVAIFVKYANFFNIVSSIGLFLLSWLYWSEDSFIGLVLLAFAFSQLFALPQLEIRSYYSSLGKFKELGYYELGQALLRHLTIILVALWLGDERCFAIAIVIVTFYDYWVSYKFLSKQHNINKPVFEIRDYCLVFGRGRWLLLGALGSVMVMQGAYFVIGLWETATTLGLYFFSFQLVSVFSIIVGEAIRKVLMPAFSSINSENERFNSFDRAMKYCAVFVIPVSFGAAMAVGPIIELLWGDKWLETIVVAQLMASTIFVPILVLVCYSYLEAIGMWKLRNIMQVADGALLLVVAGIGALIGGVFWIAFFVSIRRLLLGLIQIYMTYYKSGNDFSNLFWFMFSCVSVAALVTYLGMILAEFMAAGLWMMPIIAVISIWLTIFILTMWKLPKEFSILIKKIKRAKLYSKGVG